MARVILLGAGASKGTLGECAPISKDFGLYLRATSWAKDFPYLKAAVEFLGRRIADTSLESWALDKVWGAIDNRVKLQYIWGLSLPNAPFPLVVGGEQVNDWDPWGIAGFELSCLVTQVYGQDLHSKIQKACEGNGTLKKLFSELQAGDCVISFNYDLLAEGMLANIGKNWVRVNPYTKHDGKILLSKPHGCLSWKGYFPENGRPVEILNRPMCKNEIHRHEHPCIIAPVPFKSEIINWGLQLNKVPNFFYILVAQWQSLIDSIVAADRLVVMGYGFPSEDLHARYFFAEAAVRRNDNLQVEVYEACCQRYCQVEKNIKTAFEPGCHVTCLYKGEVEP